MRRPWKDLNEYKKRGSRESFSKKRKNGDQRWTVNTGMVKQEWTLLIRRTKSNRKTIIEKENDRLLDQI